MENPSKAITPKVNALSIDVEEHFHVHAFSKWIDQGDWENHASRVVDSTRRLLSLLRSYDAQATFFVLGWVAERQPGLIQEIADSGHEIASHGYKHQLVYEQTKAEFAEDIEHSLEAIARAVPTVKVRGYRAPSFSITKETLWAQDTLINYGIQYDSSIFPVAMHDRYGIPDANRFAYKLANGLWEFPLSTVQMAGRNLPVAGGGYFRLYPLWMTQKCINRINSEGQPAIMYIHPWEVDPEQPRVNAANRVTRFRHYVNIHKVESRLEKLLQHYEFAPVSQVFSDELALFDIEQAAKHRYSTIGQDPLAEDHLDPNQSHPDYLDSNNAYRHRNPRGTILSPASSGHVVS